MFTKTQLERYADVLLWGLKTARKASLNQGEIFLVRYNLPGNQACGDSSSPASRHGYEPGNASRCHTRNGTTIF